MLRPGNAGSNTAADHIEAARPALAEVPRHLRRKVLIRADSGGDTHDFLGLAGTTRMPPGLFGRVLHHRRDHPRHLKVPTQAWTPPYDPDGQVRDGTWVAEITGMLDLALVKAGEAT